MKRFTMSVLVVVALFSGFIGLASRTTEAQDEMMTHSCDSSLIALLYVAEYHYGFHSMDMDLATFEKGQFAPLFDAMMSMMEEDMGEMMATEEAMMDGEMMATAEPMMEDMTLLAPAMVMDEDPACTALRAELDAFLLSAFKDEMMMDEGQ
jgi:hypothetical protein